MVELRSRATLFVCVSLPGAVFDCLPEKYYPGERDPKTLYLLGIDPKAGEVGNE
jgi:hypothetical protein